MKAPPASHTLLRSIAISLRWLPAIAIAASVAEAQPDPRAIRTPRLPPFQILLSDYGMSFSTDDYVGNVGRDFAPLYVSPDGTRIAIVMPMVNDVDPERELTEEEWEQLTDKWTESVLQAIADARSKGENAVEVRAIEYINAFGYLKRGQQGLAYRFAKAVLTVLERVKQRLAEESVETDVHATLQSNATEAFIAAIVERFHAGKPNVVDAATCIVGRGDIGKAFLAAESMQGRLDVIVVLGDLPTQMNESDWTGTLANLDDVVKLLAKDPRIRLFIARPRDPKVPRWLFGAVFIVIRAIQSHTLFMAAANWIEIVEVTTDGSGTIHVARAGDALTLFKDDRVASLHEQSEERESSEVVNGVQRSDSRPFRKRPCARAGDCPPILSLLPPPPPPCPTPPCVEPTPAGAGGGVTPRPKSPTVGGVEMNVAPVGRRADLGALRKQILGTAKPDTARRSATGKERR